MADNDPKQDETKVETAEKPKEDENPKAEKKKANRKGSKGDKGKGSGRGTGGGLPSGPFGHGGSGFRLNVKNIGAALTTEQLCALFEPWGTVTGGEVKVREDGESRGFGFVIMSTEAEATRSISEINNKAVAGKPLSVSPAERRSPEDGDDQSKGKGRGTNGKGLEAWDMGFQAVMYQQQMMAWQQWYAYMATVDPTTGMPFAAPPAAASAGATSSHTEYEGSLKSISAKNGYGFIACAATYALYERDVYVDKEVLPEGVKPPDRVKFTVTLNAKNHPRAATCTNAVG